jgi:hypothetical protein
MSIGKHGAPCSGCGHRTYRQSQVCRRCESKDGVMFPDPKIAPEPYLMQCAVELLRRHDERNALLVKLGIREAA